MWNPSRRQMLQTSAQSLAALALRAQTPEKPRIGVVTSWHSKLLKPSSMEDKLDYARVRDMVWKAIEYGRPRAGSLETKIKPGSWVVVKPNIGSLPPRQSYIAGDVTDMRVTRAVLEYVAAKSHAARITLAEGGTYRRVGDPAPGDATKQKGVPVDGLTYDWTGEFADFHGSIKDLLHDLTTRFPAKRFDYVDLSYDPVRDPAGQFQWTKVPVTADGVGGFANGKLYVPAKTIVECDFLITVPVLKVHNVCGLTACLKNYVGTAPRSVYANARAFSNNRLHLEYSVEGRIDPFIADLAAFHPPDYCVVDNLQGLQYSEHSVERVGQQIRNNVVLAGEDPVAMDAMAARLIGFQPHDIDYLHMAALRKMGSMEIDGIDIAGDDPGKLRHKWGKPRNWYGRGNRQWQVTADPAAPVASWQRLTSNADTLHLSKWKYSDNYKAAVSVTSTGARKAYLWVGARGHFAASLNGQRVMEEDAATRYRIGQFQAPVELKPGENLLVFDVKPLNGDADLSVLLVGPDNDGDTADGIHFLK